MQFLYITSDDKIRGGKTIDKVKIIGVDLNATKVPIYLSEMWTEGDFENKL